MIKFKFLFAAITCDDLPDPDNGNILFMADDTAPFDLGTVATFKCYPGFVLVGAFENFTCMADHVNDIGFWDGTAPACERKSNLLTPYSFCNCNSYYTDCGEWNFFSELEVTI